MGLQQRPFLAIVASLAFGDLTNPLRVNQERFRDIGKRLTVEIFALADTVAKLKVPVGSDTRRLLERALNGAYTVKREPPPLGAYPIVVLEGWKEVEEDFLRWVTLLTAKERSPYSTILSETEEALGSDEAALNDDEQHALRSAMRRTLAYLVAVVDVQEDQLADIRAKLDFVVEASKRDNRKAVARIFLGVLSAVLINMSVDVETGKQIFKFAHQVIRESMEKAKTHREQQLPPHTPLAVLPGQILERDEEVPSDEETT